jgi:hypothetical protein
MDKQARIRGRIDYVKFLVLSDFDSFQQVWGRIFNILRDTDHALIRDKALKMRALGDAPDGNGKRRYTIEAWGPNSDVLAEMVPVGWFEYLTRLDVRVELPGVEADELDAYVQMLTLGRTGKRNVSTFDTRFRRKTSTRDVGGRGAFLGSRKSQSHSAIYRRGKEAPAYEARFINQRAEEIGRDIALEMTANPGADLFDVLGRAAWQWANLELRSATGARNFLELMDRIEDAHRQYQRVINAMDHLADQEDYDASYVSSVNQALAAQPGDDEWEEGFSTHSE